ncbi:MAG: hypothetical protein QOJ73_833, partial [Streptosporangiaceae bacterium]|nr:hypothetical protein [Streptosporangiaceae bacterium]
EAPDRGWGAASSIAGFAGTALLGTAFAVVERHTAEPMLDLTLFKVPAFSAASGSVTIAFFALFGFIFLVTQYFQFIRGYGPLSTGVRILPVALSIAAGSAAGSSLVVRIGTRVIVTCGLIMFGLVFAWIAGSPAREPYPQIAAQMVIMGTALGLISTPATESILSVLPPARAGTGSAVNDATREAGGALGVAVIGSVFSSMYLHKLATTPMVALPASGYAAARSSVAAALGIARHTPDSLSLTQDVTSSFMAGLHVACVVVALVCWAGAVAALRLPGRQSAAPRNHSDEAIDAGSTVVAGLPAPTGQTLIPYVTPPQEALPTSSSSRRS